MLSRFLEHHGPAPVNPRLFDRPESQLLRQSPRFCEKRLAGDVNLGLGHQQLPARLEAAVDFAQQPPLIRHFMDHHEGQGEVGLGIDAEAILLALVSRMRSATPAFVARCRSTSSIFC